ncbi:MAG: glycosyltransferase 87 family protein [Angustibacter sp.]
MTVRRRLPAAAQPLLVVGVLALAALPVAWNYLVTWPQDQWQVDVEVYREAARSILWGRPIYEHLTEPPQLLPFTYPPFAALLALPLALLPFGAVGWLWTAAQVGATYATVLIAFRPMLARAGRHRWVVGAVLAAPMLWLLPVSDGIRFGQVNAFLVLACLADVAVRRPPWVRGTLIGLATAIKLTPGVFWVHLAITRQWRTLRTVVLAAAAATIGAALVLPEASLAFWGGALNDPNRLGPNQGTSNQSIRGVLLRIGPDGAAGTALWLALAAVIAAVGFGIARRAHRAGDPVAQVAAVGLTALLVSPVSWIHHFAWVIVVVAAVMGNGGSRRRLVLGLAVYAWFVGRWPWWGVIWVQRDAVPAWVARVLQNSYSLGAVLALGLLAWSVSAPPRAAAAKGDRSAIESDHGPEREPSVNPLVDQTARKPTA